MHRFAVLSALLILPLFAEVPSTMVGHEFHQDDLPSIAAGGDGALWVAWLSWNGNRDEIGLRQYRDGEWGNIHWVPNTSGDAWLPQAAVDATGRVWVVWSEMREGNWDLYARRFDPGRQEWGTLDRLTSDPLPDINPRIATDDKGRAAVVWQGFRVHGATRNSNIFAKFLSGDQWGGEVRLTNVAANDWEPSAAFAANGDLWVAYDTYRKGNYDVMLTRISGGRLAGNEMTVANSPRFEARATVAVDTAQRVWVAWESGGPGWGKDQGYILRANPKGVPLGGVRRPMVKILDAGGQWRDPSRALASAFGENVNTYQPHVFSDGKGSVWVLAQSRNNITQPNPGGPRPANRGFWQYRAVRYTGSGWSQPEVVPTSVGRSSVKISGARLADGTLWLAWTGDGRTERFYHRPIRQQVFAGKLTAANPVTAPGWGEPGPDVVSPTQPGTEAADLAAIRGYRVNVGGRPHQIVRGDFHRHTELSWDGGGAQDGSLQDFYRYMIDAASMDFGASTDHQGGAWPYWWWYTNKMTDMYHVPGTYVPIFGYERSAIFPNGHRNVFFARRSDARVTPFHMRSGVKAFFLGQNPMGDENGIGSGDLVANDTKLLYEDIRPRGAVAISHTSGTRMGTDWRDNDPDLEPVVEIYQGARTNYEQLGAPFVVKEGTDDEHMKTAGYQPEGMVVNAWAKGYKLGIITSSDHGSTHISFAMVYTNDFSRQGILEAIRKRHTYGATDNIVLDVQMGAYFMGDEFPLNKALPIKVKARGTGPVARVEVIKDSKVIYTSEPKMAQVAFEFSDKGDVAGRHYYYIRLQQADGMIAWSSPFFVNYK